VSAPTDAIVGWLRHELARSGARGLVFGLSGGIDSAVVARLCQAAAPATALGVIMPCHSDPGDEGRVDLGATYDQLTSVVREAMLRLPEDEFPDSAHGPDDIKARVPLANIKPRLRMTVLYFVANTLNYLVAGTGNRSELVIGYFTKYGDGGVDLLPIGDLFKSGVRELARELGVPERILDKPPSAGLWLGQTDEAEMGFSYAELEDHLTKGPGAVPPPLAMRIERLVRATEHKRAMPPTPGAEP